MSEEPWFRLRPSKFMAGIRGLNANEVKAYFCIVCRIMEHRAPVEEDREILATYCEMRQSSFDKALDRLIRLKKLRRTDDGRISNAFCDAEISWLESYSENQKRAGKKSAEKRQGKQRAEPTDVQPTFNQEDRDREEKIGSGGVAGASDAEHDAILIAAGIDPTKDVTGKWLGLSAQHEVASWRALGLTQSEIVDVIRDVRRGARHPPSTLSYFRQPMQRAAGLKVAAPLDPIPPSDQATGGSRHGRQPDSLDRTQRVIAGAAARARAREARMAGWQDQDPARPLLPAGPVDPGGGGGSG